MQALVACGGRGTRMMPLTRDVPKCLLPVNGTPFIDYPLMRLKECGFTRVVMLVSYYGEQVVQWCKSGERFGLDITYSWDAGENGIQGAINNAAKLLDDTFLLTYGDTWLGEDYSAPLRYLRDCTLDRVMSIWPNDGQASLTSNVIAAGQSCRFAKSGENPRYVEAGMLALRRLPMSDTITPFYLNGLERPYEIGSPQGYAVMSRRLAYTRPLPYYHRELA
jgi:mannose-1-phosphate guanylyltransferase